MKILTEKEMYQILKDTYLKVANYDLNIPDTASKSDVQSLTASKFRSILSDKLRMEYSPMSETRYPHGFEFSIPAYCMSQKQLILMQFIMKDCEAKGLIESIYLNVDLSGDIIEIGYRRI